LILAEAPEHYAQRQELEEIKKAGVRAQSLTRQLLLFSRQKAVKPETIDVNALISDTQNMLQRLIGEDIKFETLYGKDTGYVRAKLVDRLAQLGQMIANPDDAHLVPRAAQRGEHVVFGAEVVDLRLGQLLDVVGWHELLLDHQQDPILPHRK
jgi:hypothetical protein